MKESFAKSVMLISALTLFSCSTYKTHREVASTAGGEVGNPIEGNISLDCRSMVEKKKKLVDETIERIRTITNNLNDEKTKELYTTYLENIDAHYSEYVASMDSIANGNCRGNPDYSSSSCTQYLLDPSIFDKTINTSILVEPSCSALDVYYARDGVASKTKEGVRYTQDWRPDILRFNLKVKDFSLHGGGVSYNFSVDTPEGAEVISKVFNSRNGLKLACAKTKEKDPSATYDEATNTLTALYTSKFGLFGRETFVYGPTGIGMVKTVPYYFQFSEALSSK